MLTEKDIHAQSLVYFNSGVEKTIYTRDDFRAGATWANEAAAQEIAELVEVLRRVLAKSPAGSQYPFWVEERGKIAELLKKYEK